MNKKSNEALAQARVNLDDIKERGAEALMDWDEIEEKHFTTEEIAASNLRVQLMTELAHTRHDKGISQRKLEELSGVKQPVIARMENGTNSPQIDTVLKVLGALGKTLYIGDISDLKTSATG